MRLAKDRDPFSLLSTRSDYVHTKLPIEFTMKQIVVSYFYSKVHDVYVDRVVLTKMFP